jgi:hypothetical protein
MQHPQISIITLPSNTPVPLSNDGLGYSASNLAILNNFSVNDLSRINATSIQELRQALGQSVVLAQHLLKNSRLTATAMVVDYNCLRQ